MEYEKKLSRIARHVGRVINKYPPGEPESAEKIEKELKAYSEDLTDWAFSTSKDIINAIDKAQRSMWSANARRISNALKVGLETSGMKVVKSTLLQEQVKLIKSIPLDAAERVNDITMKILVDGSRSSEYIQEIMDSGNVSEGKARVIARTETSRTSSTLTQYRAMEVGSEGYIWRTARAAGTRPSHADMEGKFVKWTNPPTLDKLTGHAGCLPNCRCWVEPVFADED